MTDATGRQGLGGRWIWWVLLAALAVGIYSLVVWSLFMFQGGWQMGLACLILLAAPPALWLVFRGKAKGGKGGQE